jgi:predicted  nucleic acid-binding Zn-ribbon protein
LSDVSPDERHGSAEVVTSYVRALRVRASAFHALRALCAALGTASVYVVAVGALTGPVVTPLFAHGALALLGALMGLVLIAGLWPVRALRGTGSCDLLAEREPVLASRVRSALELRTDAAVGSPELVAAHARAVRDAVVALPVSEVVPLRWLNHRAVVAGLGCVALAALALSTNEGLWGGARALLHPAQLRPDGLRVASVVESMHAHLIYPSYLGMEPADLADPSAIKAPRGTTVELTISPRLPATQGAIVLADTRIGLSATPNGRLFARFVVHESTALALRVNSGGHAYEDSRARSVTALDDQKPTAELGTHDAGRTVDLKDSVALRWKAGDDHGVSIVELVIRSQNGQEQRLRLWSSLAANKPQRKLEDESSLVPAEIGAEPGDVLMLWLEARDGDVVSGPNVGVSKPVNLEIATDAQQLSLRLPLLREVLDGALGSLADRLETAVPEQAAFAEQRFVELREASQGWLSSLQQLIAAARQHTADRTLDVEQLQGVLDRTHRELGREAALYAGGGHAQRQRTDADTRLVGEHERDSLLLSDMLAQALVDEARSLTRELGELKNHIADLLQQLKAHKSPEAERALLSEIAKAQRRLRELAQSLARLSNRVPSEFINREALPQNDAKGALDQLRASVESGDLEGAERQLEALAQQIDQLSQHIESGGARFREAHFGAHDQAMAEAQRQIGALASEQTRLAERTHELVKRAAARAKSQAKGPEASAEMQHAADELERDIQALHDSDPASPESPWLERARARLRDAADAMRTGDMAEARGMSAAASSSLEQAASSLGQDARVFPGSGGAVRQRAEAASAAASKLRRLQKQIDQATPQLGQFVGEPERHQMRGDVDPQQKARQQAEALQAQVGRGPEGTPISPDAERGLQQAAESMRRAERALERGDPQAASLEQADAGERLRQLEERLRRKGSGSPQQQASRGRESGREGNGLGTRVDGQVRIPGADEFSGPVQMRRRLLDAMREQAPTGFKPAIERYYEELLR